MITDAHAASLAAAYARNVDVYHAAVQRLNDEHRAALAKARDDFEAANGQVSARLQQLVAESR